MTTGPARTLDAFDHERLVLIVVGSHLQAEILHRPAAYRMVRSIEEWIRRPSSEAVSPPFQPVVCTDVWYLNNPDLHERPTIAVGSPGLNAAAAHLAVRLPTAYVIDGVVQVSMDVDHPTLHACVWGPDGAATDLAVRAFADRYLDGFLAHASVRTRG
jgi:hypothetical protein